MREQAAPHVCVALYIRQIVFRSLGNYINYLGVGNDAHCWILSPDRWLGGHQERLHRIAKLQSRVGTCRV